MLSVLNGPILFNYSITLVICIAFSHYFTSHVVNLEMLDWSESMDLILTLDFHLKDGGT